MTVLKKEKNEMRSSFKIRKHEMRFLSEKFKMVWRLHLKIRKFTFLLWKN